MTPSDSPDFALAPVLASLPPALADAPALARLRTLARRLPPVYSGGFECRLAQPGDEVELQLCLTRHDPLATDATPALRRALAQALPVAPAWRSLDGFLADWRAGPLDELWLEFDPSPAGWRPSLFLGLPRALGKANFPHLAAALDRLLGVAGWSAWRANLERCFDACPDGAHVSHVGVMLGRAAPWLRVNVKRLRPDTFAAYLDAVAWPGDLAAALALADGLFAAADRLTLALDVGADIAPRLGLECMAQGGWVGATEDWARLLDHLVGQGWCRPEAREALLAWPRRLSPATERAAWPADLARAALLAPLDRFVDLNLALHHVKVGLAADGACQAKAYLWFGHTLPPAASLDAAAPLYHRWSPPAGPLPPILDRVRLCFAHLTDIYLDHLGTTFQAYLLAADGDVPVSNRAFARRAGLLDGMRVLDAGCGVAGPALDIARALAVDIEGITVCPRQVAVGERLIAEAGLADRVTIRLGDYHQLPWPDAHFDAVLFLESSNHTEDPEALFREAWRVLRPGGRLYIVDTCALEDLDPAQAAALALFDRLFADNTRTLARTRAALTAAGFTAVASADLTGQVSARRWNEASTRVRGGREELTPFGAAHHQLYPTPDGQPPIFCGEARAIKPATTT